MVMVIIRVIIVIVFVIVVVTFIVIVFVDVVVCVVCVVCVVVIGSFVARGRAEAAKLQVLAQHRPLRKANMRVYTR
jgi:hypothetical protein